MEPVLRLFNHQPTPHPCTRETGETLTDSTLLNSLLSKDEECGMNGHECTTSLNERGSTSGLVEEKAEDERVFNPIHEDISPHRTEWADFSNHFASSNEDSGRDATEVESGREVVRAPNRYVELARTRMSYKSTSSDEFGDFEQSDLADKTSLDIVSLWKDACKQTELFTSDNNKGEIPLLSRDQLDLKTLAEGTK